MVWCGGSFASPLRCDELWAYQQEHGWPNDDEAIDPEGTESPVTADYTVDFHSSDGEIWSLGRRAHKVDRRSARCLAQFAIVAVEQRVGALQTEGTR